MTSSNYNNFYFNKENYKWSNGKYYYYQTNLETEDIPSNGYYSIYTGPKRIVKIYINVRFKQHVDSGYVFGVYSTNRDYHYTYFSFFQKDGKRQYDGTSIFEIDAFELELYYFVQVMKYFEDEYMIINNLTVQYEETYLCFDHISYKSDILNEINN